MPTDLSYAELEGWEAILLWVYATPVAINAVYSLSRLTNVLRFLYYTRFGTAKPPPPGVIPEGEEPKVTIQVCTFNEAQVIEETINAACSVDWPRNKLCVQVLDDSTDHTCAIIEDACLRWRQAGVNCRRLTRPDRVGYKAGALRHNTPNVEGEFVALFDADHRAHPQFLRRTVPYFFTTEGKDYAKMGLVQCPWAYYNEDANLLTRCDALSLDMAFVIEQDSRSRHFGFFSFNGTGGIWRTAAVEAGGGWEWDTVTEDLDLSYRAHIAGYSMMYVSDLPQALEVPARLAAYKQQKHRWTKGYAQVTRKSLGHFLRNPKLSISLKIEAFFHLTTNFQYVCTLWMLLWLPVLSYCNIFIWQWMALTMFAIFPWLFAALVGIFNKVSSPWDEYDTLLDRCCRMMYIPCACILAMGMTINETVSFLEGLFSKDATFIRTPKEGLTGGLDDLTEEDQYVDEEEARAKQAGGDSPVDMDEIAKRKRRRLRARTTYKAQVKIFGLLAEIGMVVYTTFFVVILYLRADKTTSDLVEVFVMLLAALGFAWVAGSTIANMIEPYLCCASQRRRKRRRLVTHAEEADNNKPAAPSRASVAAPSHASAAVLAQ
jgi:cellulose synthase/poly-beta-1,6-N-acetylglucosamine synthase-like glycosyltransferase